MSDHRLTLPIGRQLAEARQVIARLGLTESDELLAVWFDGWCFGYTTGAHDAATMLPPTP